MILKQIFLSIYQVTNFRAINFFLLMLIIFPYNSYYLLFYDYYIVI